MMLVREKFLEIIRDLAETKSYKLAQEIKRYKVKVVAPGFDVC